MDAIVVNEHHSDLKSHGHEYEEISASNKATTLIKLAASACNLSLIAE